MNPENARKVFAETLELLRDFPAPWWLSRGTALGMHLHHFSDEWLRHDTDLDISVWGGVKEREWLKERFIDGGGFRSFRQYSKGGVPVQFCVVRDGILVDFYFWQESEAEPDLLICNFEKGQSIKLKRHAAERVFADGYWMPAPIREYLFWQFGAKWHMPHTRKGPSYLEASHIIRSGEDIMPLTAPKVAKRCCGPSFFARAVSLGQAAGRALSAGMAGEQVLCTTEQYRGRLAICRACPSGMYRAPGKLKGATCEACGCLLKAKAKLRTENCPHKHWKEKPFVPAPTRGE